MDHLFWDGKGKAFYPKMKKNTQNNGPAERTKKQRRKPVAGYERPNQVYEV
jgi:hypothetical protein